MREDFLYYIWQYQLYNHNVLSYTGQAIEVIKPGFRNLHDGPDFKEAHIKIDGIKWYGAVEIHVRSSDWYQHGHQQDMNYDHVILHVVYEDDKEVATTQGERIPTLALKGAIKPRLLSQYQVLIQNTAPISCEAQLHEVPVIQRLSMAEQVLVERLKRKSTLMLEELAQTQNDWQEVTFRMITRSMGFKSNDEAMLLLARRISYKWLLKMKRKEDVETMLLGTAGLLNGTFKDQELVEMKKRYLFMKTKYPSLQELPLTYWKFAPLRPYNQPAQRIVQLAALIYHCHNLWDTFLIHANAKMLKLTMKAELSPYWQTHVAPDRPLQKALRHISSRTLDHLLINVTSPLLAAYAQYHHDPRYMEKAVNLLMQLSPEHNRVSRLWQSMNWKVSNAFDSQALNELYQQYCQPKRCLSCKIGVNLLKSDY